MTNQKDNFNTPNRFCGMTATGNDGASVQTGNVITTSSNDRNAREVSWQ